MYVDTSKRGKYVRHLLRESFREDGKVKHNTLANLSHCSDEEIQAIKLALKHKKNLTELASLSSTVSIKQGLSIGAVFVVYEIAKRLGVAGALGTSDQGRLALWQVIARVIDQGSRLSAVRLATSHGACDLLKLSAFDEDDLYKNLDWLSEHQDRIENDLLRHAHPNKKPRIFLYDVTSSYFEGVQNEYAAFGYNRDGKKGKRQIVIGLLCDEEGRPLSIEVFPGNTQDPSTFASQLRKVAQRFGDREVTFVGDRGMIKSPQIKELCDAEGDFHYITAITKPQIEKLLKDGVFQIGLFDEELAEIVSNEGIRYILRRNPIRAQEMQASREDRLNTLRRVVNKNNEYLAQHPRALVRAAMRRTEHKNKKLKLATWVCVSASGRQLSLAIDNEALAQERKLDGCYVLKTDLKKSVMQKEKVHERYKDLALVEWAFRTGKTVVLEMRPIFVRLRSRTRGHAFVVMLAYLIIRELAKCWANINLTVEEGLKELTSLTADEVHIDGKTRFQTIPTPRHSVSEILKAAQVRLPKAIPGTGIRVATKRSLQERRNLK